MRFRWFSRWADHHGATDVVGIDVATKMLERARAAVVVRIGANRLDMRRLNLGPPATIDELEPGKRAAPVIRLQHAPSEYLAMR